MFTNPILDFGAYRLELGKIPTDVYNVKAFGAKGDGIADDTAAIQAAIDAAKGKASFAAETTGGIVFFPESIEYKVSRTLLARDNAGVSLIGAGKTKSNIHYTGDSVLLDLGNSNNYRGVIKGLRLTGNVGALAYTAIDIGTAGNQIYIEDCWISSFGKGIYGHPFADANIRNNVFEYVISPIYLENAADILVAGNQFYNCGPVSQGPGVKPQSIYLSGCSRIAIVHNRIVSDAPMSEQDAVIYVSNSDGILVAHNTQNLDNTMVAKMVHVTGASKRVVIADNVFGKSFYATIHVDGASFDVLVMGNVLAGTKNAPYNAIVIDGNAYNVGIVQNVVEETLQGYDIGAGAGVHDLVIVGNCLGGSVYADSAAYRVLLHDNDVQGAITYLSDPPIYGSWKQGDIVWNPAPAAGGYIGWVCVTGGSPGTWKGFGAIAS